MSIALNGISKRFGSFPALDNVDLAVEPGEFLALLGPSGSGKTTLLRVIAGLEFPDQGTVAFDGGDVTSLKVAEREIGFVFQHYALFKHMTVAENVGFGLSVRKRADRPSRKAIRERARELLELVQLGELGDRYPAQLSGGQRQRVALARALAINPKFLLLDEPFGALDAKVRKELRQWLRAFHDRLGLTTIFVTHDQEEALEMADRVVVMQRGRIEQIASPREIYEKPANAFVYDFVGESNGVPVTIADGAVRFGGQRLDVEASGHAPGDYWMFFRPNEARIVDGAAPGLPAVVTGARPRNGRERVEAKVEGLDAPIELIVTEGPVPQAGSRVTIVPTSAALFVSDD